MASERFDQLESQLNLLKEHLLPLELDPTGQYAEQEKVETAALGYRVLCHAEFESYFEDRAIEVTDRARAAWQASGFVSRPVLCVLAFSGREMTTPPDTLHPPSDNKRKAWPALVDISEKIAPALTSFFRYIRFDNHGIKEKNLLAMLLPIGIKPDSLDPIFLTEMESFGSLRGIAAHSSSRQGARQAVDPSAELRRIQMILSGASKIDELIDGVLQEIPTTN
jgi:hypothetical protein